MEAPLSAAMPFLFASLKVAVAIALTGAIVGELPTGAQSGIGSRMLAGSYYGQTIQIWSALVAHPLWPQRWFTAWAGLSASSTGRWGRA